MKLYAIKVRRIVDVDRLIKEDRDEWEQIVGIHRFEAENEDHALDEFHETIPIACLDHFEIEVIEEG